MNKHVLIILLCLVPATCAHALGRLFFTPQQRAQLEQSHPGGGPKLNGILQKHGGRRTLWIDGQMQVTPGGGPTDSHLLPQPDLSLRRQKVGEHAP